MDAFPIKVCDRQHGSTVRPLRVHRQGLLLQRHGSDRIPQVDRGHLPGLRLGHPCYLPVKREPHARRRSHHSQGQGEEAEVLPQGWRPHSEG